MANHLEHETSPYLKQHADNPVDWYPWGPEALGRASREDRPLLISIGYSACHWCHVMAHESFEDPLVAGLMNEHFVNIKIDREERPDLDEIYMQAVVSQTGHGGWPMTLFALPDGKPFYGGTYFPPEDRHGLPGFPRLLQAIADAFKQQRGNLEQTAATLSAALSESHKSGGVKSGVPGNETLDLAFANMSRSLDRENGGFGQAPKFPQAPALEFLMRYGKRSGNRRAMDMITLTLDKMAGGGIYDQLGGGFHRYATDESWLVPHFEKMLYDNALLSRVYLHGFQVTGNQTYRRITEETLDYILRELKSPEGGFYSSQDADTEGEEGLSYLWTPDQIAAALDVGDTQVMTAYLGVTPRGHLDGRSVMHLAGPTADETVVNRAKEKLLAVRARRSQPATDTKILTSWNGLALSALAEAGCALERDDYIRSAEANADFLASKLIVDGRLLHDYAEGLAKTGAFLQDYAFLIEGLLLLHESTFKGKWLKLAADLSRTAAAEFWDDTKGKWYDTARDTPGLFTRPGNVSDSPMPSGASQMSLGLLKVSHITANEEFRRIATRAISDMAGAMKGSQLATPNWLNATDFLLGEPAEIAVMGDTTLPETRQMMHVICGSYLPNRVVAAFDPIDTDPARDLAMLVDKTMIGRQSTVYVCQGHSCQEPVTGAGALKELLDRSG